MASDSLAVVSQCVVGVVGSGGGFGVDGGGGQPRDGVYELVFDVVGELLLGQSGVNVFCVMQSPVH